MHSWMHPDVRRTFQKTDPEGYKKESLTEVWQSSLLSLCSEGLATAACLAGDHPKVQG